MSEISWKEYITNNNFVLCTRTHRKLRNTETENEYVRVFFENHLTLIAIIPTVQIYGRFLERLSLTYHSGSVVLLWYGVVREHTVRMLAVAYLRTWRVRLSACPSVQCLQQHHILHGDCVSEMRHRIRCGHSVTLAFRYVVSVLKIVRKQLCWSKDAFPRKLLNLPSYF